MNEKTLRTIEVEQRLKNEEIVTVEVPLRIKKRKRANFDALKGASSYTLFGSEQSVEKLFVL